MTSGGTSVSDRAPPPFQFTLRYLFGAMAVVCLLAAAYSWFGPAAIIVAVALLFVGALISGLAQTRPVVAAEACVVLAIIFVLAAWLLPPINGDARGAARRMQCQLNLKRLALAVIQYHDDFGVFPPACIADSHGNPLHSWRVLLLPYLRQQELYNQYRFDEPWDGPNNAKLHGTILNVFGCPTHSTPRPSAETSYVAVAGPTTVWPDQSQQSIRRVDVTDGSSNTLLLVEVENSGIHWMEPRDLHITQMPMAINPPRGQGISSGHKGGVNAAFADGSIYFLKSGTPPATLRGWLTRNGKEPVVAP